MKPIIASFVVSLLASAAAFAQGTGFTYQGRLTESGTPATGVYDLTFTLYNAPSGGSTVGASNVVNDLGVTNGVFTSALDFGASAFDGSGRWLQIAVRPGASAGAYTNLSPRQQITSSPYAIRAANAANAVTAASANSVAASNIVGGIPLAQLPSSLVTNGAIGVDVSGSFTGNGSGLRNVQVDSLVVSAVQAWGANFFGQSTEPPVVRAGVKAVAAGGGHTVALMNDGRVVAWGDNQFGQTNVPAAAQSGVIAIAAGFFHTMALKDSGRVVAWGDNDYGQSTAPPSAQSGVVAIAAGFYHSLALKTNGSVVAWGTNDLGQLNVPPAAQSGVVAIAAGETHSVALKNDGSVVTWPISGLPPAMLSDVVAIAAGYRSIMVLKSNGSVMAVDWGSFNDSVPAAAQSNVIAIAAGGFHMVALKNDGRLVVWSSNNDYGQTNVPPAAQSNVVAIAAGIQHTVAIVRRPVDLWDGATGTVADDRLSPNVALRAGGNAFTGDQTITGGDLGIGTTSPTSDLHVVGTHSQSHATIESSSTIGTWMRLKNTSAGGRDWSIWTSGSGNGEGTGKLIVETSVGPATYFTTNGVGMGTSSPATRLHVTGGTDASPTGGGYIVSGPTSGANIVLDENEIMARNNGAVSTLFLNANGGTVAMGTASANTGVTLHVAGDAAVDGQLDVDGNVGIGTANPSAPLHVVDSRNSAFPAARIDASSTFGTWLRLGNASPGGRDWNIISTGSGNGEGPGKLVINDGSPRLVIATNGNVGIDNDNPFDRFMVGSARCNGSLWINSSDRNLKQDFAAVDPLDVLAKVTALSIQTWSYKMQPGEKHVGPVAQDFHAAFGTGSDDKSIATVDADGVALAAIQGLNQKLEKENAELRGRLEKLERLVNEQQGGVK